MITILTLGGIIQAIQTKHFNIPDKCWSQPVWPDVGIKSSPNFTMVAKDVTKAIFLWKTNTKKVAKHLGYFCTNICWREFKKMAILVTLIILT